LDDGALARGGVEGEHGRHLGRKGYVGLRKDEGGWEKRKEMVAVREGGREK
jgi:hypothetical protein